MRQLIVKFEGRQDHAGGCPMEERADAGLAAMRYAAALDVAIHEACGKVSSHTESTCTGAVWTFPNLQGFVSHSTVPGSVQLTLQYRAPTEMALELIEELARAHCDVDDNTRQAKVFLPFHQHSRRLQHQRGTQALKSCNDGARPSRVRRCGCTHGGWQLTTGGTGGVLTMPSRAIHDAHVMSAIMPSSMLFVPASRASLTRLMSIRMSMTLLSVHMRTLQRQLAWCCNSVRLDRVSIYELAATIAKCEILA